jgi:signal transduction histidine kinase/DNA-binding response OmpR family regulator
MNKLFNNIPLPIKLMLIGIIPLLFMLYLAIQVHKERTDRIDLLEKFSREINENAARIRLIDDLQIERRLSFKYVLRNDEEAAMLLQRSKTDESIQTLKKLVSGNRIHFTEYTFLNQLESIRERIDTRKIPADEVLGFYSSTILRNSSLVNITARNVSALSPLSQEITGQKILSDMATYLGNARSTVYYSLITNDHTRETYNNIRSNYNIFKTLESEFKIKASSTAKKDYENALSANSTLKQTLRFIEQVNTSGQLLNDPEKWWDISASAVDKIKALQRNQLSLAQAKLSDIMAKELNEKDRNLILLILVFGLVIFILFTTIKSINDNLTTIRIAAEKIAIGSTGINLKIKTDDVIGSLAKSIIRIDNNNKLLASAADAIGKGNFDIALAPRSEVDLLGNAIVGMKHDLHKYAIENEEKIWIQTGATKINDSVRGETNIKILCENALNALVNYLQAEVGIFYVNSDDNYLELISGYAVPQDPAVPLKINHGETLIGQVALQKEMMVLQDIPDNFLRISTSLGSAKPNNIIVLPLKHNDVLEGVVELGAINNFNAATVKLLDQVGNHIAIAIQSAKSRLKLQELLEETQAQAEELQVQHSELENMNTELEAQAQKLQASEEELKVQQEELLQANQELEENTRALEEKNQLIIERNQEIQAKAEELALSTKYKSEFLANMSHELRTPLNSILLLSRLMSENNEKNLTPDQIEYAKVIQSSGNGLLSLIDEILDLSKIESGKMQLELTHTSIQEIVNDMKVLFEPVAKEKNVELKITTTENLPTIETDKLRLEQILRNLLSNALKFTSQGYVSLNITQTKDKNAIVFSVKDTGIGIPKDKQHLIFEAFQQADGSTRRKFGGTGLGLSISRELSKLLGGDINLNSKEGEGSEFVVTLPISRSLAKNYAKSETPSQVVIDKKESEEPIEEKGRERFIASTIPASIPDDRNNIQHGDKIILIIEDDINFSKALLDYTRKKGYKGLAAVRGDEGIELAIEHRPTGILLDLQLPIKDGWEVMGELKSHPATKHIPVHMMSSHEVKRESLTKGAIDFINKPVAFEQMHEMFKRIEHVLSKEQKKVLIVEENAKHAQALAYFLENFEINAEIRNNVHEGIDALMVKDVDCVILDMGIPDKAAYETLEEIRNNAEIGNIPIIIFTGKSISKTDESKIRQFADSIVVKTAHSYKRILDEVSLFLHLVEENRESNTTKKQHRELGALHEVLTGKTVLIADDDVRNIFSLTKALEKYQMNVVTAVDGKEALKQLEENKKVDVVLMDMMMPEMDGYETTRLIRKNAKYRNLPILAVTAKAMSGDREKCLHAGASDYITKPVDIDQLLSLLRVWLYDRNH